jgi:hypothetical protein
VNQKLAFEEAESARRALDLLQELVWAIGARQPDELVSGIKYLKRMAKQQSLSSTKSSRDTKKNVKALVGVMPLLLADGELFPSNEDISKFAVEALGIEIARWEKRSRYEMIGMLVMETIKLGESDLKGVTRFVSSLGANGKVLDSVKRRSRETGFTWNETIRSLSTSVE